MGPFKAGFYQTFAALFGASLKKEYDPLGEDKLTERVVHHRKITPLYLTFRVLTVDFSGVNTCHAGY